MSLDAIRKGGVLNRQNKHNLTEAKRGGHKEPGILEEENQIRAYRWFSRLEPE